MTVLSKVGFILLVLFILFYLGNDSPILESIAHLREQVTNQQGIKVIVGANVQGIDVRNELVRSVPAAGPNVSEIRAEQLSDFQSRKNWLESFVRCVLELKSQIILCVDVIIVSIDDSKSAVRCCRHFRNKVETLDECQNIQVISCVREFFYLFEIISIFSTCDQTGVFSFLLNHWVILYY